MWSDDWPSSPHAAGGGSPAPRSGDSLCLGTPARQPGPRVRPRRPRPGRLTHGSLRFRAERVSVEDARRSARFAALAMLASLKSALGDLDRVAAWVIISG